MRITKIFVKGLFGMFDHEIPLNQDSRITLVHGPNGVGKSVMLHMLHSYCEGKIGIFRSTPFEQFRIDFGDGKSITLGRQYNDATLTIQHAAGLENEVTTFKVAQSDDEEKEVDTAFGKWRFGSSCNTELIDTFRLVSSRYEAYRSASDIDYVSAFISDIEEEIRSVFSDLEGSDFFELLEVMITGKYSRWSHHEESPLESLLEWIRKWEDRIEQVRGYFLQAIEREDHEQECNFFAVIEFCRMVNARFLYKEMDFYGGHILFYNLDLGNVVDDTTVPLTALSSGEQHLLTLYYRLLFDPEYTTTHLFIIDEPEISMNVVWQRNFLNDLQRIVELRKFDVLIATHSPQIIHDKWDWVVHLGTKADD